MWKVPLSSTVHRLVLVNKIGQICKELFPFFPDSNSSNSPVKWLARGKWPFIVSVPAMKRSCFKTFYCWLRYVLICLLWRTSRGFFFFFFARTDSLPHCSFFSFFHWKRIASAERRCRRGSKHNRDKNTGFSRRRLRTRAHNATPLCHAVESTMNSGIIRCNCDNERVCVWVCKRERERD